MVVALVALGDDVLVAQRIARALRRLGKTGLSALLATHVPAALELVLGFWVFAFRSDCRGTIELLGTAVAQRRQAQEVRRLERNDHFRQ